MTVLVENGLIHSTMSYYLEWLYYLRWFDYPTCFYYSSIKKRVYTGDAIKYKSYNFFNNIQIAGRRMKVAYQPWGSLR